MKKSKSYVVLALFISSMLFGACTQDEHMDELMTNTELTQPSDDGTPDPGNPDDPTGTTGS